MEPTSATVASERIAAVLRADILAGRLGPGEAIRQETIAREHGSSRIPVREALRMLETRGLVTLRANRVARVVDMQLPECVAIYRLREQVEPLVLAESMPFLSPDAIDRLEELQHEIEALEDMDRFPELDREFHMAMYGGCDVAFLNDLVERVWDVTAHYRRTFARVVDSDHLWVIHSEHRLLIDAVRRSDVDEGARILALHMARTRHELERHPESFDTAAVARVADEASDD